MTIGDDRRIGSAEILPIMKKLYGMGTWRGALNYIKENNVPIHRTVNNPHNPKAGKPLMYLHEIVAYELSKGRRVSVDDIIIQ